MDLATATTAPTAARSQGQGGHRLAAAFDAVGRLPALEESVRRVVEQAFAEPFSAGRLADAIEADPALTAAVLRAANEIPEKRGRVGSALQAVELLSGPGVAAVVAELETYNLFQPPSDWGLAAVRFHRHAIATRSAAEQIAELGSVSDRDLVAAAALLHDIGQLVTMRLCSDSPAWLADRSLAAGQRAIRERRALGIDHCLVGSVLARRWGLPATLADALAGHHREDAEGLTATIRLADLVVHQVNGEAAPAEEIAKAASSCGLSADSLGRILYDFPHPAVQRPRRLELSPLSRREADALRGLAGGKVYREIAEQMGLSASTVRTHLHNVYRKIGVTDRAQAVLLASDKGWI